MPNRSRILDRIEEVADRHGSYRVEAYVFVMEALQRAAGALSTRRHLAGGELLDAIRELAADRFGPMAGDVFEAWGVCSTLDFGHIVFQLVDDGLLRKTPDDSLADFADRFDFDEVFAENYFHNQA